MRCDEGSTWTWHRGPAPADLGFASWVGTGASASHDGLLFDELEGSEAQAWSMRLQVTSF